MWLRVFGTLILSLFDHPLKFPCNTLSLLFGALVFEKMVSSPSLDRLFRGGIRIRVCSPEISMPVLERPLSHTFVSSCVSPSDTNTRAHAHDFFMANGFAFPILKSNTLSGDFNSCIREGGHDRPCILAPVPRKTPRPLDTWTLSSSSSEDEDESDDSGGELVVVTPVKRGVQKGARTPQQPGCSRQSTAERGKRETKKHYTVAKKLVCFGGFTLREEIDSPEERESGSKRRFFRRVESSDGVMSLLSSPDFSPSSFQTESCERVFGNFFFVCRPLTRSEIGYS